MPLPERRFLDTDGVNWRVQELQMPQRRAALYFESEGSFRRVAEYPSDWRDLTTGELEILSRGT
jgi:hypothetical protein